MAPGNKKRPKQTRPNQRRRKKIWLKRKQDALDTWHEALGAWGETTKWDSKGRMLSGKIDLIATFFDDFMESVPELLRSSNRIPPGVLAEILREVLRGVIGVLQLQHANLQPRTNHRPKGQWGRWQDPNYMAAAVAEGRINVWKAKVRERRISDNETCAGEVERIEIPAEERDRIIERSVDLVNGWHIARRKKASVQRVTALLGKARRRRLPPLILIA